MPEISAHKGKRFVLAQSFGDFNPWLIDSIVFGHLMRQNIMAGFAWPQATKLTWSKKWKREGKRPGLYIHSPVRVLLQRPSPFTRPSLPWKFHHFPTVLLGTRPLTLLYTQILEQHVAKINDYTIMKTWSDTFYHQLWNVRVPHNSDYYYCFDTVNIK
jgi:hypothetical protein